MNKIILTLVVFIFTSCVGVAPDGKSYTVAVPLSILDSSLKSQFPLSQKSNYGEVNVEEASILGKSGVDKLALGSSFSFKPSFFPTTLKGSLSLDGGLKYDANTKAVYLDSPMIKDIQFQDFALSKYVPKSTLNAIGSIISAILIKKPIYKLQNSFMGSFVKGMNIQNGELILSLGI